jgi:hypothetical protein
MKRSYVLIIAAVASAGLLIAVFSVLPRYSNPALAAPRKSENPFEDLRSSDYAPLLQGAEIDCTVSHTTTDSLDNVNACAVGETVEFCAENRATTLSGYDGLALIAETNVGEDQDPQEVAVHEDWFRLDNAEIDASYTVEAIPDRTRNYNLGIIVYDLNHQKVVEDVDALDNDSEVTFEPENAGPYFIRVFQITEDCTGRTYHLNASKVQPTATPTSTPRPSSDADGYEPNDTFDEAMAEDPTLPIQVPILLELTFHTTEDIDYFRFYTKEGRWYQATTSDLNLVDTLVEIYDEDRTRVERDDDGAGGLGSRATWNADYDGYYYIVVQNNVDSRGSYNLTLDEISAPATATPGPSPTPGATPRGQADDCESNGDFSRACVVPVNETQSFNFVPVFGEGPDNDFYKVWVKPGLHFRCETSDLSPGVDPNMIVFSGPSWEESIGGNDDIAPCNYNSRFDYYATYAGWLYVLVGTGDRTPSDIQDSGYSFGCKKSTEPFKADSAPQPTATSDSAGKLPSPVPTATPTQAGSPIATPTPGPQALSIRTLATPSPPPTAAPRFVPIDLIVYYDANGDNQPGAGEGITGVSAQAYEVATGELLAQGYTDNQGQLSLTVSSQGAVRLAIPFLGFSHLIAANGEVEEEARVQVRVPPHTIPGESS